MYQIQLRLGDCGANCIANGEHPEVECVAMSAIILCVALKAIHRRSARSVRIHTVLFGWNGMVLPVDFPRSCLRDDVFVKVHCRGQCGQVQIFV